MNTLFCRALKLAPFVLAAASTAGAQAARERTAAETYKNVRVLKDVPVSQFMNTMFIQRYSLGVSCSYCHVGQEYEKDDKPAKVKAREMIQMVLELNKNKFGGKAAVSCVTCHQGSTEPTTEISSPRLNLQQMLGPRLPGGMAPNAAAVTTSVDSVLAKYLRARGGRDALARISSRQTKGNLLTAEGTVVPFEEAFATSPPRWIYLRHFGDGLGDFVTGFDGAVAWNRDNRGLSEQDGDRRALALMNVTLAFAPDLRELYSGLRVTGTDSSGGVHAVVLFGVAKLTAGRERLFFDTQTGLLTRRSVFTDGAFGSFVTDTYYENYRTIDGIQVPIMIGEFTPDFGTVRKLFSVEQNGTLPKGLFDKPQK